MGKEDENVLIQGICLMNRYLATRQRNIEPSEIQLIAVTCYHIVSKIVEVEPIDLDTLAINFCHNKYEKERFNAIETDIFSQLSCEIETPHVLEFASFYYKCVRFYIQVSLCKLETVETYLGYCENLTKYFCRMIMMDVDLVGLRPSILGAAAIFFSLHNAQIYLPMMNEHAKKKGLRLKFTDQDFNVCIHAWLFIV
jgi:hypothetical protein